MSNVGIKITPVKQFIDGFTTDVFAFYIVQCFAGTIYPEQGRGGVTNPDTIRHRFKYLLQLTGGKYILNSFQL